MVNKLLTFPQRAPRNTRKPVMQLEASRWLKQYLSKGPKPATSVFAVGEDRGYSTRTIELAKNRTNVESYQQGRLWYWKLRGTAAESRAKVVPEMASAEYEPESVADPDENPEQDLKDLARTMLEERAARIRIVPLSSVEQELLTTNRNFEDNRKREALEDGSPIPTTPIMSDARVREIFRDALSAVPQPPEPPPTFWQEALALMENGRPEEEVKEIIHNDAALNAVALRQAIQDEKDVMRRARMKDIFELVEIERKARRQVRKPEEKS